MGGEEIRRCTSFAPACAHHLDDLAAGGAAHDRIVHQDHPLAGQHDAVGGVLQLHPEIADVVGGLDEGAADIVVADDAEVERQAALGGVAHRGGDAGIRHRHHHVGRHGGLARQLGADGLARVVDRRALHHRIRTGEVDVFEHAEPLARAAERLDAVHAPCRRSRRFRPARRRARSRRRRCRARRSPRPAPSRRCGSLPMRPRISGRTPSGSRAPISASLDSATSE